MKKIIILSTDTKHHRYFINKIEKSKNIIHSYIFENTFVKAKFKIGPTFEKQRDRFEKKYFFKKVSNELNLNKLNIFKNINSSDCEKYLKKAKPDLGVVFGTRKIDSKIIKLFKFGLINIHRGLSCKYRGLDSDLWTIYHNDIKNLGVTIHKIDNRIDTGKLIFQKIIKIDDKMRAYKIQYFCTIVQTELAIKAISNFIEKKIKLYNPTSEGRYYSHMPIDLKKLTINKFDKLCKSLK